MTAFSRILGPVTMGVVLVNTEGSIGQTAAIQQIALGHLGSGPCLAVTTRPEAWTELPQVQTLRVSTSDVEAVRTAVAEWLLGQPAGPVAVFIELAWRMSLSGRVQRPGMTESTRLREEAAYDYLIEELSHLARHQGEAAVIYVSDLVFSGNKAPFGWGGLRYAQVAMTIGLPAPGLATLALEKHRYGPKRMWGLEFNQATGIYTVATYTELREYAKGMGVPTRVLKEAGWPEKQEEEA